MLANEVVKREGKIDCAYSLIPTNPTLWSVHYCGPSLEPEDLRA